MLRVISRSRPLRYIIIFVVTPLVIFHQYLSIIPDSQSDGAREKSSLLSEKSGHSLTASRDGDQVNSDLRQDFVPASEIRKVMKESNPLLAALGTHVNTANCVYHSHVWIGDKWNEVSEQSRVCMATHTTVEHLFWLAFQGWKGPMSVAVFTPGTDYYVAVTMIYYLRKCFPSLGLSTNFHIMYPKERPPRFSSQTVADQDLRCDDPEGVNNVLLQLRSEPPLHVYPQNHNRNLAKKNCATDYSMTTDIDMITPPSMSENMTKFFNNNEESKSCTKCVFVVPVYEVHDTANFRPKDKQELIGLINNGLARRYHIKVWSPNQENSHLGIWETKISDKRDEEKRGYRILYNITSYEKYWEPILIMPQTAPLFDERFLGYGYVRNSQVYELYRRRFKFHVLDYAFLTHLGFQLSKGYNSLRKSQIKANSIRFSSFRKELKIRMKYEAKETGARD
ncbi:beta-1,4-glucuronyltransferase 1-like [Palaemon carinicauda]|uniref:beta-1,4-glucuronyltransferase 1-like n=1 Tax=Palaemon carinicauda TaxID=392227 RepID=UPI0035B5C1DB